MSEWQPRMDFGAMALRWNEETWYSRLVSIVLIFAAIPVVSFDIGVQYWQAQIAIANSAEIPGINYPHPLSEIEKTTHKATIATSTRE